MLSGVMLPYFDRPAESTGTIPVQTAVTLDSASGYQSTKVGPASANDKAFGILAGQDAAASGDAVKVIVMGEAKATLNGASVNIAPGDYLKVAAGGVLVKNATAGSFSIGRALEAVTTDGRKAAILVCPGVVPS